MRCHSERVRPGWAKNLSRSKLAGRGLGEILRFVQHDNAASSHFPAANETGSVGVLRSLSCGGGKFRGGVGRRRFGHACDRGTEPQSLKAQGVQFSRWVQAVRFLELPQSILRGVVPLSAGRSRIGTIFRERLLDFGDPIGSRLLLAALLSLGSSGRFLAVGTLVRGGSGGFLCRRALRFHRIGKHTQPRRKKQRRSQVCCTPKSDAHFCESRRELLLAVGRNFTRQVDRHQAVAILALQHLEYYIVARL